MFFITLNLLNLGLGFHAVRYFLDGPTPSPEVEKWMDSDNFRRIANGVLCLAPIPALTKLAAVCLGTDVIW